MATDREVDVIKGNSLPVQPIANAIYFIMPEGAQAFQLFVTSNQGDAIPVDIGQNSDYGLIGDLNGTNKVFKTKSTNGFVLGSVRLFVNGVRQYKGEDYVELDNFFIELTIAPESDDNLILDYLTNI